MVFQCCAGVVISSQASRRQGRLISSLLGCGGKLVAGWNIGASSHLICFLHARCQTMLSLSHSSAIYRSHSSFPSLTLSFDRITLFCAGVRGHGRRRAPGAPHPARRGVQGARHQGRDRAVHALREARVRHLHRPLAAVREIEWRLCSCLVALPSLCAVVRRLVDRSVRRPFRAVRGTPGVWVGCVVSAAPWVPQVVTCRCTAHVTMSW